jgi:hypothetical protein
MHGCDVLAEYSASSTFVPPFPTTCLSACIPHGWQHMLQFHVPDCLCGSMKSSLLTLCTRQGTAEGSFYCLCRKKAFGYHQMTQPQGSLIHNMTPWPQYMTSTTPCYHFQEAPAESSVMVTLTVTAAPSMRTCHCPALPPEQVPQCRRGDTTSARLNQC